MLALNGQSLDFIYSSHQKKLGILKTNVRKYIRVVLTGVQLGPKGGSQPARWNQVLLDKDHWVYVWVDGIYSGLRTESQMPNDLFFRVVLVLHLRISLQSE